MLVGSLISGTLVEKARHPAPVRVLLYFKICCDSQATPGSNESSSCFTALIFGLIASLYGFVRLYRKSREFELPSQMRDE